MHEFIWLAIWPTIALALAIGALIWQPWNRPGRHQRPAVPPPPAPAPPPRPRAGRDDPAVGSMDVYAERAYKHRAGPLDVKAAELAAIAAEPRPGGRSAVLVTGNGAVGYIDPAACWGSTTCPVCQARDDQPHGAGCWLGGDEDQADPFGPVPVRPVELRARSLNPDAWRPYLTEREFAEVFPGADYGPGPDTGPHTGDMLALDPFTADQIARLDAECAAYRAERAEAYAALRASLRVAWQLLACS